MACNTDDGLAFRVAVCAICNLWDNILDTIE